MAAQRERSAVAADHRSILPNTAGVPWWGAVAMALIATAIGIAFDAGSGDNELTTVFAALYVMGCVAAVLTVQQSAVFTAVIQPPLILFCAVPGAYWLFHGGSFAGLKAVAITCGYPLIERFPLMLFTAAAVLLIGMVRWYLGMVNRPATVDAAAEDTGTPRRPPLVDKLSAMLTAALNRNPAHAIERPARERTPRERTPRERTPREPRPGERPRRATPEARRAARQSTASRSTGRSSARRRDTNGSDPTRSRNIRPSTGDAPEMDRPRRRLPPDPRDEPMQRRRRPAPDRSDEPRRRSEPPPRSNRDPRTRSYRPPERSEPPQAPPRRRPSAAGGRSNGSASSHHPVSRVRYRKAAGDESGTQPPA